jgi:hypothetical protein
MLGDELHDVLELAGCATLDAARELRVVTLGGAR